MGSQTPPEKRPEEKDPWGRNTKRPTAPPDLDVLINKLSQKLKEILGGKKSNSGYKPKSSSQNITPIEAPKYFTIAIIVAASLVWALSGIFIVSPAERGVITRFGKYAQTVEPGPHWYPRFIESQQIVDVQRVSTYAYESEMLTRDENIVSVAVAVQYRIENAKDFLFNVVDPVRSLEQATASALRQVVGHNGLDDLLTTGRTQVREQVAEQLQTILTSYQSGIRVTDVTLQSVRPPEAVTAAFDDAIKAREDQQAYVNKADAYTNQVSADAQGKISRIVQEAEAYRQQVVLEAQASVAGFLALLPEYTLAPQIMRQRLYLSTMETVLSQTAKIFLDQKNGNPIIYLPLDKLQGLSGKNAKEWTAPPNSSPSSTDLATTVSVATSTDTSSESNVDNNKPSNTNTNRNLFLNRPTYQSREGT